MHANPSSQLNHPQNEPLQSSTTRQCSATNRQAAQEHEPTQQPTLTNPVRYLGKLSSKRRHAELVNANNLRQLVGRIVVPGATATDEQLTGNSAANNAGVYYPELGRPGDIKKRNQIADYNAVIEVEDRRHRAPIEPILTRESIYNRTRRKQPFVLVDDWVEKQHQSDPPHPDARAPPRKSSFVSFPERFMSKNAAKFPVAQKKSTTTLSAFRHYNGDVEKIYDNNIRRRYLLRERQREKTTEENFKFTRVPPPRASLSADDAVAAVDSAKINGNPNRRALKFAAARKTNDMLNPILDVAEGCAKGAGSNTWTTEIRQKFQPYASDRYEAAHKIAANPTTHAQPHGRSYQLPRLQFPEYLDFAQQMKGTNKRHEYKGLFLY